MSFYHSPVNLLYAHLEETRNWHFRRGGFFLHVFHRSSRLMLALINSGLFTHLRAFVSSVVRLSSSDFSLITIYLIHTSFTRVVTRVFRYFKGIKVIFAALRRKWFAFTLFIGVATICAFTFSAALFFVEKTGETYDNERQLWIRNVDKTISPFQSIYGTMWWGVAVRDDIFFQKLFDSTFYNTCFLSIP